MLTATPTAWHLSVPDADVAIAGIVPESLRRFIEQRVAQLAPAEQAMLEAASVAGATFSVAAVCAGLDQTAAHVQATCDAWGRQGRFIQSAGVETWPDGTVAASYRFIHALYHEVIYERVAAAHRTWLHRQIGRRKEAGYGRRAQDIAAELAMHFVSGQDGPRAVRYLRDAGQHAMQRYAYPEAVAYFEQALHTLRPLPDSRANRAQAIDLCFDLHRALFTLSAYDRVLAYLREAASLAEALNDPHRLGWACVNLSNHFGNAGEATLAITHGQRALALAISLGDFALRVRARLHLGQAYFYLGRFEQVLDQVRQNVVTIKGHRLREFCGGTGLPAILSRTWWVLSLAETGEFREGHARREELLQMAEALNHPWSRNSAYFGAAQLALRQGAWGHATELLERGLTLSHDLSLAHWTRVLAPRLSFAYAHLDRMDEALALMMQAQEQPLASNMIIWLSEVNLQAGRVQEASQQATHVLAFAQSHQHRVLEAWALRLLGEILRRHQSQQSDAAETYFRRALTLSDNLGMRPLQAHCHHGLGALYRQTGQAAQAHRERTAATDMYREMEMTFWLAE